MLEQTQKLIADSIQAQTKVVSLFQFIRELNKLKQKAIVNYEDYPWAKTVSSLPDDPDNIFVFYRDRVDNDGSADDDNILLSVRKPEFEKCPPPDPLFAQWLQPGWDLFKNAPLYYEVLPLTQNNTLTKESSLSVIDDKAECFTDNVERFNSYSKWVEVRREWVDHQYIIHQTRKLFADLYHLYFELQRDSETKELIVANGILCDKKNPNVKHPVLTKRVKINYDPVNNVVFVEETDSQPELYTIVFQMMDDVNMLAINPLQVDLSKNDYHPMDRNDTPAFLKALVHQLSSDSRFSESGVPENWRKGNRLLLYMDSIFIMRKRLDGTFKAIEQIIENVKETGYIPAPIREIVSGGKAELPDDGNEETLEEQLAAVGGESGDVLLSKAANKEQLEIAKRIEKYNAVLVQGPPGTGKTHTIANLMGHFLAQGKSVLVTSHTSKALHVLKDKVASGVQNLCVSVLEDSNVDMERSIDGITDFMSQNTSHEIKKEMDKIAEERRQIISDLADVRRKIFRIINQECNSIVYNGVEISPSKAAAFVFEHAEDFSYIPGWVHPDSPLPMSFSELVELYRSNVALMKACIEQPEYKGKSFGVISLLGDEQARCVQQLIEKTIDPDDLVERKILCGNASNFQGDERDVVFLSVVDSVTADHPAPIHLQNYGSDDSIRKRYNVAASRAKDQLWVVDSLDAATDLKNGDIRKMLIDYSLNPNAVELRHAEIEKKADSPFEISVVEALINRGYKLIQQWKVGAYRLDMVVVCGKKTVAIECDGERCHSGEAKIREDMERQTILERLGWRFIRIRGSEFFRDPDKTIERVVYELSRYGINPEADDKNVEPVAESFELLERVKARAASIIASSKDDEYLDMETVEAALNTNGAIETINNSSKARNTSDENENQSIQMSMFEFHPKNE